MNRELLINKTIDCLKQLPPEKVNEVAEFTEFLLQKYEKKILIDGIQKLSAESKSFDFLKEEEDLYTLKDLKEIYNAKG